MASVSDYCITAGTFARLCGATRDTLRYYRDRGILVPQKDERNGYAYYSHAQIASYFFIKTFRQLGCSVEDIQTYLLGGERAPFDAFVDKQYEALLQEREELERRIAVIAGTRDLLAEIRAADVGGPCLHTLPDGMKLQTTSILSEPATSVGEIMPDILRHLHGGNIPAVQTFPIGASIRSEDFMKGEYRYRQVFSFAGEQAEGENILPLGGRACAVQVCRDSDGDIEKHYKALRDFLRRKGLKMTSDLFSLSIVNVIDPHETRRYLKYLFVCVD